MKHVISCPAVNRQVTAGQYVAIVRKVQAAPPGTTFKDSFQTWWPATREEILRQVSEMVQNIINRHLPPTGKGNKAQRRAKQMADTKAECTWCGQKTGDARKRCCSDDCYRCCYS